jgi:hypothetical protein
MTEPDFDPMLDCYLSWEAAIAEMRRRHLAGEPIGRLWREAEERQRRLRDQDTAR